MKFFRALLLLILMAAGLPSTALAQGSANCGFLGRKIQFADGAETCVRDVALFKRSGLIENAPTISYESRIAGSKTYAIAVTANPNVCPFSTFISWDWTGHDASSALPGCNAKLTDAVSQRGVSAGVGCRCEVVVDNGRSALTQKGFQERVADLERQLLAGGRPLNGRTLLAEGADSAPSTLSTPGSSSPLGAAQASFVVASAVPAAPVLPAVIAAAPEAALRIDKEQLERFQDSARQSESRAEQERTTQAQAEAKRLEGVRKAREQLAAEEAERRAERERLAQVEAKRLEDERKAREQLARQEEERKARELLAAQEAGRRADQERLALAEADRRLQEERRRMDEERAQLARLDRERALEQARLARELAELRRMLEERNRAEAAARSSFSVPSQYTERVALVIGNRSYVVSPLVNPINDARAVKDRLQAVGFKVLYFEDLKVTQIGDVLEQLHATLKPGAAFVFFYAGHGTQIDGENFFPAVDAKMTSAFQMPTQSLELARVIKVAESRKAAMNLLILDACRDNPWQVASRTAARGLSKIEPAAGTLVFYATRPGSVAADGSRAGHGLFTYHLLQHLNTPMTPVEQVFKRVAADVLRESAGKQVPWVEGQLVGDFAFVER
jgi:chemotaxis protein histidine kinase CheA